MYMYNDAFDFQNLSQFWYSDETALRLSEEALSIAGENGRYGCTDLACS